jgi:hypothetical protein
MAALAERASVTTWAASLLRSPTNADAPITIAGRLCASDGDVMLLATAKQRPTVRCLATSR